MKETQKRHPLEDYTISYYKPTLDDNNNLSKSIYSKNITKELNFKELPEYFFQSNIEKDYRDYFIFSNIIDKDTPVDDVRRKVNFNVSPFVVVDIDTKKIIESESLKLDGGVEKLFNFFKNDPHCFICGYSASGNGLRAIYAVKGSYNFHTETLYEEDIFVETALSVYKFRNVINHIKNSGFAHIETYLDKSFIKNYAQGTFSLNGLFDHNINFDFLQIEPKNKFKYTETKLVEYVKTDLNDIDKEELIKSIRNIKHRYSMDYNSILPFFSAMQLIDDIDILKALYINFINNYEGTKSKKQYFSSFPGFLKNISKNKFRYKVDLIQILKSRFGVVVKKKVKVSTKQNTTDIFGREYDYEYTYKKYITEIENIDLSNNSIVIRSDAGSGKSFFILNYLTKQKGIRIFAAPTNPLAEQVYEKYSKKYSSVKFYKFFGGDYQKFDEDCIIITNFSNLERLEKEMFLYSLDASVLVLDEIHKITDYSIFNSKQCIFPVSKKSIFMSATPEPFLMGEKDYTYINFKRETGINKRNLTLVHSTSKDLSRNKICKMIYDKYVTDKCKSKFVIFQNNKDDNKKISNSFKESIYLKSLDIDVIDSKTKDDNYNSIINNSIMINNLITTSLLNEGVNILNKDIEDVYIIDNNTQSVFDVYQFCERFRVSSPNIYYFYHNSFTKKDEEDFLNLDYNNFDELYKIKKLTSDSDIKLIQKTENNFNYNIDFLNTRNIFNDRGNYKINKNKIKLEIYNEFKRKSRSNIYYFKTLLQSYFNIGQIESISSNEDKQKNSKEEVEYLKNNIDKVINKIIKNINCVDENENELMNKIIKNNQSTINKIIRRYNRINKVELDYKEFDLFSSTDKFKNEYNKKLHKKIKSNSLLSKNDKLHIECYNSVLELLKTYKDYDLFLEEVEKINHTLLSQFQINKFDELKIVNKKLLDNGFDIRYKKDKRIDKIIQCKR